MNLTKLALKRPVSCFLVILALAVFGISSIFGFKMELTPDIEMPMLIVMATPAQTRRAWMNSWHPLSKIPVPP